MENTITIGQSNVEIKEYGGQRVVTLKDVDDVHGRPSGTARRNFCRNKKRFIEGEDYFKICANEFRTDKICANEL
ncbi:MAG: ORF6N domain-containing protein [Oscillospiraceae bacterium]|nr:ORF6N domain-containing protein [Oscillospiraceae bacterium]